MLEKSEPPRIRKTRGSQSKANAALQLQGQSSEKSSQDRLSVQEREEADCSPGDASVSSLRAAASTSSGGHSLRSSSLRTRNRGQKAKTTTLSPRGGTSADPDWSPALVNREEEVSCPPQVPAQASSGKAGSSKACEAVPSKETIEVAQSEASAKRERAVKLLAAARSLSLESSRASKRQKLPSKQPHKSGGSSCPLIGARLSVFWPNDKQFYKGRVVNKRADGAEHQIEYDDKWTEWLSLSNERFQLLLPRAASAGCQKPLLEYLRSLEPDGLSPTGDKQTAARPSTDPPEGAAALGWMVKILSLVDGQLYEGQLIAYNVESGKHHILYSDGEDEWIDTREESIEWLHRLERPKPVGVKEGHEAPTAEAAIGWSVGVYWRDAGSFFPATVSAYHAASGLHHIIYSGGEEEEIRFQDEILKWSHPPSSKQDHILKPGNLLDAPFATTPQRRWTFKTSRPRSSRSLGTKRQSSWANLSLEPKDEGVGSVKAENQEEGSVSRIFEYVGPTEDKSPLLSSKRPSLGYLGEAGKALGSCHSLPGRLEPQMSLKASNRSLSRLDDIHAEVAPSSFDDGSPWRMGGPFQGFEYAPEAPISVIQHVKAEDPASQLGLPFADKPVTAIERPSTAPSPVPLLDNANHQAFSESLLVAEDLHCQPDLQNHHLGSGNVSSDSLEMCEDYLDINVLVDTPVDPPAADWYSLQSI